MTRYLQHLRCLLCLPGLVLGLLSACNDTAVKDPTENPDERLLVAKQVESEDELIGGPSARGAIGDFLIQNDKVRFIIGGERQTFMGGVFGGTLLDADKVRSKSDQWYGRGWDAFSETFPLVNLLVTNPNLDGNDIKLSKDGSELIAVTSGIEVIKDGSDGEAIVRVKGRAGYIFEMLKFLNKDFLASFLAQPLSFSGLSLPIDKLLNDFFGVNVYALLDRLQLDFTFETDYILRPGESFLTLRTTVTTAPPSEKAMARCPEVTCDLDCPDGFAFKEISYNLDPAKETCDPKKELCGKAMCPACACAEKGADMATINESEDIFKIMLGDIDPWRDPAWKGGLLGGDFLFMGSDVDIFTPGIGFNEETKVFHNLWQGVPTLASPMMFPWIASAGENVSYGWVSRNPDVKEGFACPTWRIAIASLPYSVEQKTINVLSSKLGISAQEAAIKVRQAIVDRRPIILKDGIPAGDQGSIEDWKASVLASAKIPAKLPDPEDEDKLIETEVELKGLFPDEVALDVLPAADCRPAQLIIPLFSTSATAVMTHKSPSSMKVVEGTPIDDKRRFTFERYFVVGDGDVATVLDTVYGLVGQKHGRVKGTVVAEGSLTPLSHVSVFAVRDPRDSASDPAPTSYDQLLTACRDKFGEAGIVSQMQSDLGLDTVQDGNFGGPLPAGRYFLVAFEKETGVGIPVPVEVTEGETSTATVLLPSAGLVRYKIEDEGGYSIPSRITFVRLDQDGNPLPWEGLNRTELGGSTTEMGIMKLVHSTSGVGTVELPAGDYEVYVSRGFEYSIWHKKPFTVMAGREASLSAALVHEVDTTGWISGDFHNHTIMSIDAGVPIRDRLAATATEGVEFLTSNDHDFLTYFQPFINEMGLTRFMKGDTGVETSTLEFGHYNAFPLNYLDTSLPVHEAPAWYGKPLDVVWQMLRDLAEPGFNPSEVIIQVNHPRDGQMGYFAQMGLKGYNLERDTPGMAMCNPQSERISCDFDAIELFNEKRFELLRTPTIAEVNWYNKCLNEIYKAPDAASFELKGNPDDTICGSVQQDPHDDCSTIEATITSTDAEDFALAELYSRRDHCRWHAEFKAEMTACSKLDLISAKRRGLDAIKMLSVRYMIERSPEEQEAFYATTSATDLGCDMEKAMEGCEPILDDKGEYAAGCSKPECVIGVCVCASKPECCLKPGKTDDNGVVGTGWTEECAATAHAECHACGVRPCTSKAQTWEDWFSLLNAGFVVTGVGNSDTHGTTKELGQPRNYIVSSTDDPYAMDRKEIYANVKAGKVIVSTGPFARFSILGAGVGETVSGASGDKLPVRIRIESPSWFGVDHIEIIRNAKLEKVIRVDPDPADIVDFDEVVELTMPTEDSWYVLIAYGLDSRYNMSPVYKRAPWGQMLISTIIAMGGESILLSFSGLLAEVEPILGGFGMSLDGLLAGLLGGSDLPDVFSMMPLLITNPIWVDLEADGFKPVNAKDADGNGQWDLPSFCSLPCEVQPLDVDGVTTWGQSTCGENQVCRPETEGANTGLCVIPIPDNCVGVQTAD